MSELLAWAGMLIAFGGVIWGKIAIGGAKDHVKAEHPQAFETMSDFGTPMLKNLSPVDNRVKRALATKLLTGALPGGLGKDPRMLEFSRAWRHAIGAILLGFALTAAGLWSGMPG